MHTFDLRRFVMIIAAAAFIGVLASHWVSPPASASRVASYCGGTGCINHTWLWLPALRRAH